MAVKSLKRSTVKSAANVDNSMAAGYSFQDFHHLETISIGANTASVVLNVSSYAGEYSNLQIRMIARSTNGAASDSMALRFNGDSGSNYSEHVLYGDTSSVSSAAGSSQTFMSASTMAGATATAGTFGPAIVDILDAFSSSKNKVIKSLSGISNTFVQLRSGCWYSTAPINSITLYGANGGSSLVAGTQISLYGIR